MPRKAAKPARPKQKKPPRAERAADALATYRSKRDFRLTPEPSGAASRRRKALAGPLFVVQKHAASHLHYDFRLEIAGVLKSWAVPKGPPSRAGERRLAVATEDHPLEYASFTGIIPDGEYGAGTVELWDAGNYLNLKHDRAGNEISMEECWRAGQIEIWLDSKKTRGGYVLVNSRLGGNAKNWLLIKMRDETTRLLLAAAAHRAPKTARIRTGR